MDINFFQAFIKNGVHGQRWPQVFYAVTMYKRYPCGHINTFMAKSISKKIHAEDEVIIYLERLLMHKELWPPKITLFLSHSPCHRCSQQIINFLDNARQQHGVSLLIEVIFSSFYQIRRPSCEQNPACRDHLPSYAHHKSQVAALMKLYSTHGVVLRTFQTEDWQNLGDLLGVRTFIDREKEDNLIRKDFEQLFGPVFTITRIIFLNWADSLMDLSAGQSHTALTAARSPQAITDGRSPTSLSAGRSPTSLSAGRSPTSLSAGRSPTSLSAGRSPTSLSAGRSSTSAGRSPTSLSAGQSLAADAVQPSSIKLCFFYFLGIITAFLLWILLQGSYSLNMVNPH